MTPRPLFLLSLPRSGSTLVQRVLASHPDVATRAEPWILLPQLYALKDRGAVAEYGHGPAARALADFTASLPGGREDYLAEVRRFTVDLYGRAAGDGARLFLDKTPRYHLVAEELFTVFPDAKVVFLWRNPLAVVASIVETWAGGRWSIGRWRVDLFDGVANLTAAYRAHRNEAFAVRYEDLVTGGLEPWRALFGYAEVSFEPELLSRTLAGRPEGRMGDPTGSRTYAGLAVEPLEKWKRSLANPYRRRWACRYLRWIGRERLALMGYDLDGLLAELGSVPSSPRLLGSDLARATFGSVTAQRRARAFRKLSGPGRF